MIKNNEPIEEKGPTFETTSEETKRYFQSLTPGLQLLQYQEELIALDEKRRYIESDYREKCLEKIQQHAMTNEEVECVKRNLCAGKDAYFKILNGIFYDVYRKDVDFNTVLGLTMSEIIAGDDYVVFVTTDNRVFYMYHFQDCCESVYIEDVCGDWSDLIGSPILIADEVESEDWPDGVEKNGDPESFTWTFYKIGTINGVVTLRWYGESNGYYSESVDFCQCWPEIEYNEEAFKESEEYKKADAEINAQIEKIQAFREQHNIVGL